MRAATNWGADYQKDFDGIYPALAKKYDVPLYPFFLDGVALDPKLNQPDMLHPNPAGVAVIVGRIAPAVEQLARQAGGVTPCCGSSSVSSCRPSSSYRCP